MIIVFIRTDDKDKKQEHELMKFLRIKNFAFSVKDAQDYFDTLKQIENGKNKI